MHNCKITRPGLIDLALGEAQARSSPRATANGADKNARLLAELSSCSACRAEYAALRRALNVVDQATLFAMPAEGFWSGYHSRLTQRLKHAAATNSNDGLQLQPRTSFRGWSSLKKIAGASVRIPVPVAAVLFLLFGLSMFLVIRLSGQTRQEPLSPVTVVETRTIPVPVIKETVVTRVVYVAKQRRPSPAQPRSDGVPDLSEATARLAKEPANKTTLNLEGFRPPDQVKLTIIKGSYQDEK